MSVTTSCMKMVTTREVEYLPMAFPSTVAPLSVTPFWLMFKSVMLILRFKPLARKIAPTSPNLLLDTSRQVTDLLNWSANKIQTTYQQSMVKDRYKPNCWVWEWSYLTVVMSPMALAPSLPALLILRSRVVIYTLSSSMVHKLRKPSTPRPFSFKFNSWI